MVPLDRALVSSYRRSVVTMSLSAAAWLQFAPQVFVGGAGNYRYIARKLCKLVSKYVYIASLQEQAVRSAIPRYGKKQSFWREKIGFLKVFKGF